MLLTCPSCETRYQVDEAAIDRAAGRQVRCANCGYLWHFAPSLEENLPTQAAAAAGPAAAGSAARATASKAAPPPAPSPTPHLGSPAAPPPRPLAPRPPPIFHARA